MHDDAPGLRFAPRGERRARERFDWFRDEVAVDFPSLGAAADRMRESFLTTDASVAPFCAEVRLSSHDTRESRRVPIDLALRSTCIACGGRGEVRSGSCAPCAGTGDGVTRHRVHVKLPSGVRDGARFFFSVTPPFAPATVIDLRVTVD
jgi:hypothetical protein